jgi:hypothetical protein
LDLLKVCFGTVWPLLPEQALVILFR